MNENKYCLSEFTKKKFIFYFRCKICGNILRIKIYDDYGLCISCKCGIKI